MTLRILAIHEQLAWISSRMNARPQELRRARLNRLYDLPLAGRRTYLMATEREKRLPVGVKRRLPHPVEPWAFWNHYLANFQWARDGDTPPRRRTADDISEAEVAGSRRAITSLLEAAGKPRLLSKYTDFPRMAYLSRIFPEARFIHIVRDGRAVAASYMSKIESGKFGTWNEREWWISGWPEDWRVRWQERFGDLASFVAYQWKFFVREIRRDAEEIGPDQYAEFNYADIVEAPTGTIGEMLAFCDLDASEAIDWYLEHIRLENMNQKWQSKFSDSQKMELDKIICEPEYRSLLTA
jgi:hypothetical protein